MRRICLGGVEWHQWLLIRRRCGSHKCERCTCVVLSTSELVDALDSWVCWCALLRIKYTRTTTPRVRRDREKTLPTKQGVNMYTQQHTANAPPYHKITTHANASIFITQAPYRVAQIVTAATKTRNVDARTTPTTRKYTLSPFLARRHQKRAGDCGFSEH